MEDKINKLETRTIDTTESTCELSGTLEDATKKIKKLTERLAAAERALNILSNTLHAFSRQ